jgi:chemotaxis signal transduction protein
MTTPDPITDSIKSRLHKLRDEFDSNFARPWAPERQAGESLFCFTADDGRFAIPLTALQALVKAGPIVPVPSRAFGLLGLTVVRAKVLPVYSIGRFTGGAPRGAAPPWLASLRGPSPAALAIDSLDGYTQSDSLADSAAGPAGPFIQGIVQHNGYFYALLDCVTLYDTITQPVSHSMKGQDEES